MILAAAEYAETLEGEPPPDLELALQVERWHALPDAGGLLDQPAGLLDRMGAALNVFRAFRGYMDADDKTAWVNRNPWAGRIIESVTELRRND